MGWTSLPRSRRVGVGSPGDMARKRIRDCEDIIKGPTLYFLAGIVMIAYSSILALQQPFHRGRATSQSATGEKVSHPENVFGVLVLLLPDQNSAHRRLPSTLRCWHQESGPHLVHDRIVEFVAVELCTHASNH